MNRKSFIMTDRFLNQGKFADNYLYNYEEISFQDVWDDASTPIDLSITDTAFVTYEFTLNNSNKRPVFVSFDTTFYVYITFSTVTFNTGIYLCGASSNIGYGIADREQIFYTKYLERSILPYMQNIHVPTSPVIHNKAYDLRFSTFLQPGTTRFYVTMQNVQKFFWRAFDMDGKTAADQSDVATFAFEVDNYFPAGVSLETPSVSNTALVV